ncbi:hypothetical protein K2173_007317 [Erythroxylum novogranatense]|uniref:procollagen-proline 4-dioxygenase n=1 Tax=Erythroxylum novogranatense TaxID=1862640 RepID=A0AAV8T6D6_9ROSI|nr:hypothetical protein K2173_007317 [Erythroxylum novogranatense]
MAPKVRNSIRLQAKKWPKLTILWTMLLILTTGLFLLLGLKIFSIPINTEGDSPIELSRRKTSESFIDVLEMRGKQWAEIISWEPRAIVYHNFLSKEECDHLISLAKPHMKKSTVIDSKTGKSVDSRVRTSSGMFLSRGQDQIVQAIEKRIADFTFIPVENGESLQILHYEIGQKYEPHYDFFLDDFNTRHGGQRTATVLMYLSDVEEGGETVFPSAKANFSSVPWWNDLSKCGKQGLSLKPKMGDALLFWSTTPDASLDPSSLHGSCPVIKGNKWSATKWMHLLEYKL